MKLRILASAVFLSVAALSGCHETKVPDMRAETIPQEPLPAPSPTETVEPTFSSTSLRNPNDGSLVGGVPLPLSALGLQFNPKRDPAARYGTLEVVQALVNAGETVHRELGGGPITINDLSYENGGPIPHHSSHQNGRDVDVFFYQLGPDGRPDRKSVV